MDHLDYQEVENQNHHSCAALSCEMVLLATPHSGMHHGRKGSCHLQKTLQEQGDVQFVGDTNATLREELLQNQKHLQTH
jgi:hypothetical protein